jgi:hypothetical protein
LGLKALSWPCCTQQDKVSENHCPQGVTATGQSQPQNESHLSPVVEEAGERPNIWVAALWPMAGLPCPHPLSPKAKNIWLLASLQEG